MSKRTDDYDFILPPNAVAQHPVSPRDAARLMVVSSDTDHVGDASGLHDAHVIDLPSFLRPGDLLVRNDTQVIPARLHGRRSGGGKTEFLLIHSLVNTPESTDFADLPVNDAVWNALVDAPLPGTPENAATIPFGGCYKNGTDVVHHRWLCLARPANHLKPGAVVRFVADGVEWPVRVEARLGGGKIVASFPVPHGESFFDWLDRAGQIPLPPYIRRSVDDSPPATVLRATDRERYQTHFARHAGAVAAPTAGLHFTPALDEALRARGVELASLTLHVGPGTFRPVMTDRLDDHVLDAEYFSIPPETVDAIRRTRARGGRVMAVGTTTARTLEAVADTLLSDETNPTVTGLSGWTTLFIQPGYVWRIVDGLMTNFHLPRSTLLVLVASRVGRERILAAYQRAMNSGYRFYSYGDAMLLL